METKKTKKANLENKKVLFLEIGLVLVLGIVLLSFEWGTPELNKNQLGDVNMEDMMEEEIINTFQEEEPPPPPEKKEEPEPEQVIEELTVVEDDEEESDIDIDSESDEDTQVEIDMSSFKDEEEEVEPIAFAVVEDKPEFPGGDAALMKFLSKHTKYPEIAKENGIQGKVYVQFVIDKNGNVTSVSIVRGVDPYLDKEAKRVVSQLPDWKPGQQRGQPVPVTYIVPINFKLY
ncbi:MAG: energy transducer TonB [Candidatus Delongbacteria bacterium]|jgi:protein TonB|nr:energy transducer TonB [Candidatus Delongbacteria bacterium]